MIVLRTLRVTVLALLLGTGSTAHADGTIRKAEIHDKQHLYCLMQQDGFTESKAPDSLRAYQGPEDSVQTLRVLEYPTSKTWKRGQAYFDEVEADLVKKTKGYKLVTKKHYRLDGVPALDIAFYRDGKNGREHVWKRFLFHKGFGLIATAAAPVKADKPVYNRSRRFTRSLRPWFGRH